MAESLVSLTYGTALYEAARDGQKTERVLQEISELASLIEKEADFKEFLNSPALDDDEKKAVIEKIFRGRYCDEVVNFLFVLIDKDRTQQLNKIARQYLSLYDAEKGIAEGYIYSTIPLKDELLTRFEEEMARLLRKKVRLENRIDESLIGGVKIQADGKLIDKSLKSDLDRLRKELEANEGGKTTL